MAYSPPEYPAAIPDQITDLPDQTDDIDWIEAWIYNYVKKELLAVMTELGTDPAGTEATVAARLTAIEASGVDESVIMNIYLNSFRIAILGSYAVMNMVKGISDEYEDETGIDTTASENEDYDSVNDLYSPAAGNRATGGTITYDGNYVIHTFTAGGTFTPNAAFDVEYLVVAGGGGGAGRHGGGGGAGGLLASTGLSLSALTNYTVTIGAGGAGAIDGAIGRICYSGENSVFSTLSAIGGGHGGSNETMVAVSGGSGGGGGGFSVYAGGTGTSGQGHDGGDGGGSYYGGGGGGSGGVGGSYVSGVSVGGIGSSNSISGASVTYGVGGGSGGHTEATQGVAGAVNTGNGGGGSGGNTKAGGAGGSGIVIIKYVGNSPYSQGIIIF